MHLAHHIHIILKLIGQYHTDKSKIGKLRKNKYIFYMRVEKLVSISLKWKFIKRNRQITFEMTTSI